MCGQVFEGKYPIPTQVVATVRKILHEMNILQHKHDFHHNREQRQEPSRGHHTMGEQNWIRPTVRSIKINCDATCNRDTGKGGLGVISRNHKGQVVGGFQGQAYAASSDILEARAIY